MSKFVGTVAVTGTITPVDTNDNYPLMDIKHIKGANYTVATYDELLAIPLPRRAEYMKVEVAETNTTYQWVNNDWREIAQNSGSTSLDGIDVSQLVFKKDVDVFNPAAFEEKLTTLLNDGKKDLLTLDRFDTFNPAAFEEKLTTLLNDGKKDLLTLDRFDTFNPAAFEEKIEQIITNGRNSMSQLIIDHKNELVFAKDLVEFDPDAHIDRVNEFINIAKQDVLTVDRFDTFNPGAFEEKLLNMLNEGKKELLTVARFDVFNPRTYEERLDGIIVQARGEFSLMERLEEVDIEQLKQEIKQMVLAELDTIKAEIKQSILDELRTSGTI